MTATSVGFIGGGRITRVFLSGWEKSGMRPAKVVVSDVDAGTLEKLQQAHGDYIFIRTGSDRRPRSDPRQTVGGRRANDGRSLPFQVNGRLREDQALNMSHAADFPRIDRVKRENEHVG